MHKEASASGSGEDPRAPTTCESSAGSRVGRGALSLISSRLLKQLAGFAVEVALVRWLAPEVWENVSRWLTFSLTATVLLQFGFPESVLSLGARCADDRQAKSLMWRASSFLSLLTLVCACPLVFFPEHRQRLLGDAALGVLGGFALYVAAEGVLGTIPSFFVARGHVRAAAAFGLVSRVPTIVGALLAVWSGPSLARVTCFMAVGSTLSAVVGLLLCERLTPGRSETEVPFGLRAQLRYAMPVGLTRIAQMANNQLDKLVILATLPGAAFGTYYLGAFEVQLVPMVCQAVTTVLVPELARSKDRAEFLALWHATVQKTLLLTPPTFAFLFTFAELALTVVYGPAHRAAALPFRIFQLLLLHRFTNYALIFQALGQPRVPLVASLLMLVINVPLCFVLSQTYGMTGAAAATVLSLYASTVYTFVALRRALDVPWSRILPWSAYAKTLCVALAALPAPLFAKGFVDDGWMALLTAFFLYIVSYLVLGRAADVIGVGEHRFISDAFRLRFLRKVGARETTRTPNLEGS